MMRNETADLGVIVAEGGPTESGVEHGAALLAFTDAILAEDDRALIETRATLRNVAGADRTVDAAAVAANFERMVRIADGTGIPLDAPLEDASGELRDELGLGRFAAGHVE